MYNEIVTVTKYCLPLKREIVCVFVCARSVPNLPCMTCSPHLLAIPVQLMRPSLAKTCRVQQVTLHNIGALPFISREPHVAYALFMSTTLKIKEKESVPELGK